MEDNADAVHAVLELRIRKAILVGHSMGGYVAFAELYPENVKHWFY
jgi:pimeloyl-ACP methyl ester carboxylesterase